MTMQHRSYFHFFLFSLVLHSRLKRGGFCYDRNENSSYCENICRPLKDLTDLFFFPLTHFIKEQMLKFDFRQFGNKLINFRGHHFNRERARTASIPQSLMLVVKKKTVLALALERFYLKACQT